MKFSENLKYSREHIWLLADGDRGIVGITDFAQNELNEIVFVELPSVGKSFNKDEVFGSVEAIKTVSDLFMPVSGTISEVNQALKANPSLVNDEPFDGGWLIKIRIANPAELKDLLAADEYQKIVTS